MDTQTQGMSFSQRFSEYFDREVACMAAKSIKDGAEIEFIIDNDNPAGIETFTLTKVSGKNSILSQPARTPQLVFKVTPPAAQAILDYPSDEIGPIGVHIVRMIVKPEAGKKISVQFKAGFLGLFSHGYFGVLTAGGSQFASFLAAHGLNGMSAIKNVLKKMKA
ncbi:hypothetical protein WDW37_13140 [Bdellovibrionota bacterium FG-1]